MSSQTYIRQTLHRLTSIALIVYLLFSISFYPWLTSHTTVAYAASDPSNGLDHPVRDSQPIPLFAPPNDAPGGVSNSLKLWFKANEGAYTDAACTPGNEASEGNVVACWRDHSGNGFNATHTTVGQQPTLRANRLNGQAAIEYDGSDDRLATPSLNLFATNTSGLTIFTVFDTDDNSAQRFVVNQGFSPGCATSLELGYDTGLGVGSGNYGLHVGCSRASIAPADTIANDTYYLMTTQVLTSGNTPTNINHFQNGTSLSVSDDVSGWANAGAYDTRAATVDIGIRNSSGSGAFSGPHDGDIAEVIVYTDTLNSVSRVQVESYLGLKYGLTLDNGSDYLDSSGTSIFASSTITSHINDIAGIGIDQGSALTLTTASSINSGAMLAITGSLVTLADGEFLIWGNDGGALTGTTDIPSGYVERLTRSWRLDETGEVGNTDVKFDLSSVIDSDFTSASALTLLVDDDGNFSNATALATAVSNGNSITFDGVGLNDGVYFTLALPQLGPGGVTNNLMLWLKADSGTKNSNVAVSSGDIDEWEDQSDNGVDMLDIGGLPTLSDSDALFNNHPVLTLDSDSMTTSSALTFDTTGVSIFAVASRDGSSSTFGRILTNQNNQRIYFGSNSNGTQFGTQYENGTWDGNDFDTGVVLAVDTPYILTSIFDGLPALTESPYVNGTAAITDNTTHEWAAFSNGLNFGSENGANSQPWRGKVAEVIVYKGDVYTTSLTAHRQIESYLALKYGITLDSGIDYLSANGTTIYPSSGSHSGYTNDIAGIGIDTGSGLIQLASRSSNSDQMVAMTGTIASISSGEFLIWGNDDGVLTDTTQTPNGYSERLTRLWRVSETGDTGDVTLSVDLSNVSDLDFTNATSLTLLVDTDTNFTNATGVAIGQVVSNSATFNGVDLNNGDYFTLAIAGSSAGATLTITKIASPSDGTDFDFSLNGPGLPSSDPHSFLSKWGILGSGDGQFNRAVGVAVDGNDYVYVVDYSNRRIQKFDSAGTYVAQWGSAGSGDGQFNNPYDIVVNSNGDVFVADTSNNRIQKFDSNGTYITQWGGSGSGDGQFNNPYGVAVDSNDNVYVADYLNHRVQKFDSNGVYLSQWGSVGSGNGQFDRPIGVAIDSSDNVYISELNNDRVQKFDSSGAYITQWGSLGSGNGQFNNPYNVMVDNHDHVYVVDYSNRRIQKFDISGAYLSQWGSNGSGDGQFSDPTGAAVDSNNNIYVAGYNNHRIQKFAPVNGQATFTLDHEASQTDSISQSITFTDLVSGTFTLSETVTSGWQLDSISCGTPSGNVTTLSLSYGAQVTCVFTNSQLNSAPIITEGDSTSVVMDEDSTPTAFSLTLNATDADLDTLTWSILNQASNGTASASGTGLSKVVEYTPTADYNGADLFVVQVDDGNSGTDVITVNVTINAVNDAPSFTSGGDQTVIEDAGAQTIVGWATSISTGPAYESGQTQTFSISNNNNGLFSMQPDVDEISGDLTFTPATDANGNALVTAVLQDNGGTANGGVDTVTQTFTITITPQNDLPIVNPDSYSVNENSSNNSLDVLANDVNPDVDGDALTISAVGTTDNGGTANTDGNTITYSPAVSFLGTEVFTYQVSDGNGGTAVTTVNITVDNINDPPVALDDTFIVDEDSTLNDLLVLDNDSDPDLGTTLTITAVSMASSGTVSISGTTSIAYTPTANFVGQATFNYTISDGALTDTATVTVTVNNVNDAPSFTSNPVIIGAQDTAYLYNITTNDIDSGDTVVISGTVVPGWLNLADQGDGTATLSGAPTDSEVGDHDVTLLVQDTGGLTDTQSFVISISDVNDPPVISDIADQMMPEDTVRGPIPFTIDDLETVYEALSISISTTNESLIPLSNIVMTGSGGDLALTLTPLANQSGVATVTVTLSDGGLSDNTTFLLTVTPVNDAPTALTLSNVAVSENQASGTVIGTLTSTDIDTNDSHSYSLVSGTGDSDNDYFMLDVDQLKSNTVFDFEMENSYSIRVRTTDSGGLSFEQVFVILITNANDAPTAEDDFAETTLGQSITMAVLSNDTDPDADSLQLMTVSNPASGTVNINGINITYDPDPAFVGTESFSYTVEDGNGGQDSALVTVLVTPADSDDVQAVDDTIITTEDMPIMVSVLANDMADVALSLIYVSPSNGGETTLLNDQAWFTPTLNFSGVATFTYVVLAGEVSGSSATVSVTVLAVNDDPTAESDNATTNEGEAVLIDVLSNDSDVDGDIVTLAAIEQPSQGLVLMNGNGQVTYTPDDGFFGQDEFGYTIVDGEGGSATGQVNVTVLEINRRPTGVEDNIFGFEDNDTVIDVLANDTDPNADDTLQVIAVTQAQSGTTMLLSSGLVQYTPAANYFGSDSFAYILHDSGGLTATGSVSLTILAVSDPPVANPTFEQTPANQPINGINVLGDAANADDEELKIESFTQPQSGTVTLNPDGTFDFTPEPGFEGVVTFEYTVAISNPVAQRPMAGRATAATLRTNKATLLVGNVSGDVTANDASSSVDEGARVTLNPLNNAAGGLSSLVLIGLQRRIGLLEANDDGTVSYTPPVGFSGTDVMTYTVSDGATGIATAQISITVKAVNRPPNAVNDLVAATEDTPLIINAQDNDVDREDNVISITQVSPATYGTVSLDVDGNVVYTPTANFSGLDQFGYVLVDEFGEIDYGVVTVVVADVNDQPVARDDVFILNEDEANILTLTGNDTDADEDFLQVSLSSPVYGAVQATPLQTVNYIPPMDFSGIDVMTYTVSDGQGGASTAVVTITVNAINDNPVAITDTAMITVGETVIIPVLSNDSDVDSVTLHINTVQADNGTVSIQNDTVLYTPDAGVARLDEVIYTIIDEQGGSATGVILVTVTVIDGETIYLPVVQR